MKDNNVSGIATFIIFVLSALIVEVVWNLVSKYPYSILAIGFLIIWFIVKFR